jgi:hypothetical protein
MLQVFDHLRPAVHPLNSNLDTLEPSNIHEGGGQFINWPMVEPSDLSNIVSP